MVDTPHPPRPWGHLLYLIYNHLSHKTGYMVAILKKIPNNYKFEPMKRLLLIALVLFLACEDKKDDPLPLDCAGVTNGNSEILAYWYDADNDGLGAGESSQFCNISVEEGWVLNNDDEDDNCTSNVHDCTGICDGDSEVDMCGVCGGNGTTPCPLNFSLEDLNPSSETFGVNIGPQFFNEKVTLYYFPYSET